VCPIAEAIRQDRKKKSCPAYGGDNPYRRTDELSQSRLVHDSEGMTHPRSYYRTRSAMTLAEWFRAHRLDRVVVALRRSRLHRLVLGGLPFSRLPKELSSRLYETLRPDVEELEAMLDRDLSSWKSPKATTIR
jgi:hypothetical protein